MRRKDGILVMVLGVLLIVSGVQATVSVRYTDPVWTYEYAGSPDTYSASAWSSLDATWDHGNSSDNWYGDKIAAAWFGGVESMTNGTGGVTFLRIQDAFPWSSANNARIFFNQYSTLYGAGDTLLDGVTITCRCRLSTDLGGAISKIDNDGGDDYGWPAEGKGFQIDYEGKGHFGIKDGNLSDSTIRCIAFSLAPATQAGELKGKTGLTMNNLNGTTPTVDVDTDSSGTVNVVEVDDLDDWHEFWITIQADTSGGGTHKVTVYVDGDTTGVVKHVTASNSYDNGDGDPGRYQEETVMFMGCPGSDAYSSIDVDFIAWKAGVNVPTANAALAPVAISDPAAGGGGPTTVMQGGYTDTLEVVLTQNPGTSVTVTMTPNNNYIDLGSGFGSAHPLSFDGTNWSTPQTVNITANNASAYSGIVYSVINSTYSAGGTIPSHAVSVVGRSTQIAITRPGDGVEVLEGSAATDSYDVWVTSGTLPITISDVADPCQVVPSPASTTVTAGSASTISVRAYDDGILESDPHSTLIFNKHTTLLVPSVIPAILENECGAWGYQSTDYNEDCLTDVSDLASFVAEWLNCSLPQAAGCTNYN